MLQNGYVYIHSRVKNKNYLLKYMYKFYNLSHFNAIFVSLVRFIHIHIHVHVHIDIHT